MIALAMTWMYGQTLERSTFWGLETIMSEKDTWERTRGIGPKQVDIGVSSHCLSQGVNCHEDTEKLNGRDYSFTGYQPAFIYSDPMTLQCADGHLVGNYEWAY